MSRSNGRANTRFRDEPSDGFSGRIPKKSKTSNGTGSSSIAVKTEQSSVTSSSAPPAAAIETEPSAATSTSAAIDDDPLDPMAQARKAMEMFQSVTGETIPHSFSNASSGGGDDEKKPAATMPAPTTTVQKPEKTEAEKAAEKQKREEEEAAERKKREEEEAAVKKKREEEAARQKQRIADGEAKRRAFRPKIATAFDSLL